MRRAGSLTAVTRASLMLFGEGRPASVTECFGDLHQSGVFVETGIRERVFHSHDGISQSAQVARFANR